MSNQTFTNGWRVCSISEIAELSNGGTPSKSNETFWKDGTVPFVTAADLTDLYVSEGRSKLTAVGLNSGKTPICEPGDLLIGTRTRVGNCSIAKARMGASQDITRARLNKGCLPEFFRYYFAHVSSELGFYSQGTSIQGITRETLEELEIPVPPLTEQRRLVARIESLTGLLEQARQAGKRPSPRPPHVCVPPSLALSPTQPSHVSVRSAKSPALSAATRFPKTRRHPSRARSASA